MAERQGEEEQDQGPWGEQVKPIIILPIGAMAKEEIEQLRANDLCVVEAQDPAAVRFLDPIPAMVSRTQVEEAAIALSRKLLSPHFWKTEETRNMVSARFVEILLRGMPLVDATSIAEQPTGKRKVKGDG